MNAKEIYYLVLGGLSVAGATVAQHLGGWDGLTKVLAYVMLVDYATGWLCAAVWHKSPKTETGGYESRIGFKGLVRKGVIVLIVMIAAELDKLTESTSMRTATILFFVANDGMSILENLGIMGVPFPPALKNAFEVLRQKSDEKGGKTERTIVNTDGHQPQSEGVGEKEYEGKHENDPAFWNGGFKGGDSDEEDAVK